MLGYFFMFNCMLNHGMLIGKLVICFHNLRNMYRTLRNEAKKRTPEFQIVQGSFSGSYQNQSVVGLTGQAAE